MSIIVEIAKAIHNTEQPSPHHVEWDNLTQEEKDWYLEDAQASWEVAKAKMLGDDVRERCIAAVAEADAFATGLSGKEYNHYILKAALTAAIQKLEE